MNTIAFPSPSQLLLVGHHHEALPLSRHGRAQSAQATAELQDQSVTMTSAPGGQLLKNPFLLLNTIELLLPDWNGGGSEVSPQMISVLDMKVAICLAHPSHLSSKPPGFNRPQLSESSCCRPSGWQPCLEPCHILAADPALMFSGPTKGYQRI